MIILYQVLGTPTESTWPGITTHEEYHSYGFLYYDKEPLLNHAPRLEMEGLDLLGKLLCVRFKKLSSALRCICSKSLYLT